MSTVETPVAPSLVTRVKNILLKPSTEWEVIAAEPATRAGLTTGYVMILAAIPALAGLIGNSLIGFSLFGISSKVPLISGVIVAAISYALAIAGVYIAAFVINALAPSFGGTKDDIQAFKVAAYSGTAMWLAGIFALLTLLSPLAILGLYGLYLLYTGLPRLMKAPADKALGYTAVVVIVALVIQLVIGMITGPIIAMSTMSALGGQGLPHVSAAGNMKIDTPNGKVELNANAMEDAAKRMEQAAKDMENGTAKPPVDATRLDALLPQSFKGAQKGEAGSSSGGAGNYSGSEAHATYSWGDSRVELKVSDIGALGAMAALGTAMKVQSSSQSGGSYEKISSDNGRMISEKYDADTRSGSYSIVTGDRIVIEASGTGVDMATLKAAAASVNEGQALALLK